MPFDSRARKLPGSEASLPGSFLARESNGINPGAGYLRLALVSSLAECSEAVDRIVSFLTTYDPKS